MKIALSTDHAGFDQLKALKEFLSSKGYECLDFGPKEMDPDDDYPDFILPAAKAVADGQADLGIIFGGSGQGEAMVANRVKGVHCSVYYGPAKAVSSVDADGNSATDDYEILRLTRSHNHSNMLSLAGRFLTREDIQKAVEVWLAADYSQVDRHVRRVKKMDEI